MDNIDENDVPIPTPYYVVHESKLLHNARLINDVAERAGVKIIIALKANALWKTFLIITPLFKDSTASSLNEMYLAMENLGGDVHVYCPVYTDASFEKFLQGASHITFNSLAQYNRFADRLREHNATSERKVSAGLRVNPRCSVIDTEIYNPCTAGSRFGENPDTIGEIIPEGLEGLHFHALCESSSYDLEKVLQAFENQYGKFLPKLKWVNMGGGHLMTRKDYNTDHLVKLLREFKSRYPNLEVILEPGSAFTWQTGDLEVTVLDIVSRDGVNTAIIDSSFACHMPDTLEMPYRPNIRQAIPAEDNPEASAAADSSKIANAIAYRLGGNSCLTGDYVGDWYFDKPLHSGDRLTLLDMNHYTTVKTNMFNGVQHPDIYLHTSDGRMHLLRHFTYSDYKNRMD